MLSGEGNAGDRRKTTIGLISKSNFARAAHFVLYISLPLFCTTTTCNFQNFLSYTFYGGNVVWCSRSLLVSLPPIFTLHWWPLAFLILSPPLQNFHVVLPTKKCLPCLFLALNPCRPFSRGASLACRPLSLFLCLSLALYSKFVDMTIYQSLIL